MRASLGALLFARSFAPVIALCLACSSSDVGRNDDECKPSDADGIISEPARLLVTVTDTEFSPKILTAQNSSEVTLTVKNQGSNPHGFAVDCLATPNSDGCPTQSCFPSEARLAPIAAGEQATLVFLSPFVEGIYSFHSDVTEDAELVPGQFIIQ